MPGRLKILCVISYDLDGPDNGGTLRNRHLLRLLAQTGSVCVVLADDFINPLPAKKVTGGFPVLDVIQFRQRRWNFSDRLQNEFDRKFLNTDQFLALPEERDRLKTIAEAHDLVWIHTLKLANRFNRWHWPATALDVDDVPSGVYETGLAAENSPLKKLRHWRQQLLWRRREKILPERFDAICVCSEPDREKFNGAKNIFVLPNGFPTPLKSPGRNPARPPRIGFVGNFKHTPNRDGMEWFAEKIWPAILEKFPAARLRLAGMNAEIFRHLPNADILGWVADMEMEMASWSLAAVPIRIGGGTRVKIVEAFARRCPVVSTSVGAYGYGVADGEELRLANSPEEFAEKCARVLNNPSEATAMADRAWKKFLQNWTWEAQAGRVAAVVETVLRSRPRK